MNCSGPSIDGNDLVGVVDFVDLRVVDDAAHVCIYQQMVADHPRLTVERPADRDDIKITLNSVRDTRRAGRRVKRTFVRQPARDTGLIFPLP